MTRRPLIATVGALALVLGMVPVLTAPAADAATAPAIGTVYVADTGNNRVVAIAPDGTQQDIGNGFKAPQGVAVDAAGNVFVADTGNNRVVEIPADGGPQVDVGTGLIAPTAVTVAQDNVLYVIDAGTNGEVVTMNEDGSGQARLTGNWANWGPPVAVTIGFGFIWILFGASPDAQGGALVQIGLTDHQDVRVARDHDSFGADAGYVMDPFGTSYQSDPADNVINAQTRNIGTGLNDPEGLALTVDGHVVVADKGNNRVEEMAADGSNQTTIGSGFDAPMSVAVYAPPPTFTADSPPDMFAGVPYSYTFKATAPAGEPAPRFVYVGGTALPGGITLDSSTGTLSGTPGGAPPLTIGVPVGNQFQVAAANGATETVVDVSFSLLATEFVGADPPLSTQPGDDYSYKFPVAGAGPITFSARPPIDNDNPDALPPGLTLDSSTGVLSGTPTAAGEYEFIVRATNAYGYSEAPLNLGQCCYHLDVVPHTGQPPGVVVYTPVDGQVFPAGSTPVGLFSCLAAENTTMNTCFVYVDGGERRVVGEPLVTTPGPHTAVVIGTQSDGKQTSVTFHYTMASAAGAPSVSVTTPADEASFVSGSVPNLAFTCTAGTSGTLKSGTDGCSASIDSGAAVGSGTALAGGVGSHTVVVTATDTDGQTASVTRHYTVTAAAGPPSATVTTPTDGASYTSGSVPDVAFTCTAGSSGTLEDGTAGCSASIDSGAAVDSGTALAGGVGSHTVVVTATDTDGQTDSVTRHYTVTAAAGPPSVTVTTPTAGASYTAGSVPDVAFTCTAGTNGTLKDGTDGCSASIDGGAAVASGTALVGTAGAHTVVVTATDTDGQTATVTRHYTVVKATPTITWATPAPLTYGTALSSAQLDATASVPGTFTYTPGAGTVLGAGIQQLQVDFTPADTTTYNSATKTVSIAVGKATPTITWPAPAPITSGTPLSGTQLDATADVPGTFTYTPPAGTVLSPGPHTLSVSFTPTDATDYNNASATVQLVVEQPPAITSADTASFRVGTYGSFTITTTGYPSGTSMHLTSSGLPAGLSLADNNDGTATLSGTPDAGTGGVHQVTITADNGVAPAATQTLTITITEAPHLTAGPTAITATVGDSVDATYTAAGYPVPTVSLTGTLPQGLSFASDAGSGAATITGVPAAGTGGVYHVTVSASNGVKPDATVAVTITVNEPPTITSADHATFTALQNDTFQVTTTGGYPAGRITFSTTGPLPSGVTLSSGGVLSGNPPVSASGYWQFTITASNGPTSTSQTFTLFVQAPPVPAGALVAPSGLNVTSLTASGECVTWALTGYAPYAPVTVIGYPRLTGGVPTQLGTFTASANGRRTVTVCLPNTARGSYALLAAGYGTSGTIHYQEARTTVQP